MFDYIFGLRFQFVPVAYIRDYRFALVFHALLTLAFVYSIGSIFWLHQDLAYTPAIALTTTWFRSFRSPSNVPAPPYFCNNATYNFVLTPEQLALTGAFAFENVSCRWFSDAVMTYMSGDQAAIATALIEQTINMASGNITYVQNFATDFDSLLYNFQHSVNLPDGTPVLNVPTTLLDSAGNVYRTFGFPDSASTYPALTFDDIFAVLGVTLDEFNPGAADAKLGFPPIRYRNTGMLIAVQLEYANAVTWQYGLSLRCTMKLNLQVGSWGNVGWMTAGDDKLVRLGVVLRYMSSGLLGQFSFTTLVTHLISSYVLIGVCRTAVVMLIKFFSACDEGFAERHKLDLQPYVFCSSHALERQDARSASGGGTSKLLSEHSASTSPGLRTGEHSDEEKDDAEAVAPSDLYRSMAM